jgi:hypothetical protein
VDEKITAVYLNRTKEIRIERSLQVCLPILKRRVYIHLVNLAGSGFSDQEIVDNLLARARDLWAQACVDLVVVPEPDGSLVRHVVDPTTVRPAWGSGPPFSQRYEDSNGNYLFNRSALSPDLKDVLAARTPAERRLSAQRGEITVYFIEYFMDPATGQANAGVRGLAANDTGYVQALVPDAAALVPEAPENLSALFIAGSPGDPRLRANGNTLAHELAHVIVDAGDKIHEEAHEGVNILAGTGQPDTSVRRKRFNDSQIDALRSSKNRFAKRQSTEVLP